MKKEIPFLDLSCISREMESALNQKFSEMVKKGVFSGGEEVLKLEENLKAFLGTKEVISCANGTDALEIALRTLGIGPGDEVIVPGLTWVSTAEAVAIVGAKPVFADTDTDGLISMIDLDQLVNPKTKAVIPVHLYGKMVDMEALMSWAKKKNLFVIEDAAQAFGAFQNGKSAGTWGDIGCFSFYPTKNLGALGEAGALVTDREDYAWQIRMMINHGQAVRDHHELIGRNSRIDSLQAGFLNVKLQFFLEDQQKRKSMAEKYLEILGPIHGLRLPSGIDEISHNAHLFVIQTEERDLLKSFLKENGVGTVVHYPNIIPKMKPYLNGNSYPVSERIALACLSLPLNPILKMEEVEKVGTLIVRFFNS